MRKLFGKKKKRTFPEVDYGPFRAQKNQKVDFPLSLRKKLKNR